MGGAVGEMTDTVELGDFGILVEMKYGIGGYARHRLMEPGDDHKVGCVRRSPKLTEGPATTGIFRHQNPGLHCPLRPVRWRPVLC